MDERDVGQKRSRVGSLMDNWPTVEELADPPEADVSKFMAEKNKNHLVLLCKQLLDS